VRDVVDLHLRAMIATNAKGRRFLAAAGEPRSLRDVAGIPHERLGEAAKRAPKKPFPDWLVRALSLVKPQLREVVTSGKVRRASTKAKRELGWTPRPTEDAIAATAESLVRPRPHEDGMSLRARRRPGVIARRACARSRV
jgi:dihydroflavonol-4-reductase